MRGRIYKRGSTWTCVYDEPSSDGQRRQRSRGGFATRRAAQAHLTDALARLDRGAYNPPSRITVAEFLADEWLEAVAATLRPSSLARYQSVVRLYVAPTIGTVRLQSLGGGQLNSLYAKLERDGLSVATRRLVHAVVGRALRDAERWGRVPRNVRRTHGRPSGP